CDRRLRDNTQARRGTAPKALAPTRSLSGLSASFVDSFRLCSEHGFLLLPHSGGVAVPFNRLAVARAVSRTSLPSRRYRISVVLAIVAKGVRCSGRFSSMGNSRPESHVCKR